MEVIIGVVSGILTATFVSGFISFIRKIVIPWYLEIRYEGVDLEDSWDSINEGDGKYTKVSLQLYQSAHKLAGAASISIRSENKPETNLSFKVEGFVWEGYVTLNLKSSSRKNISFATMLLKVCKSGGSLEGYFSARHANEDKVGSVPIMFLRAKS